LARVETHDAPVRRVGMILKGLEISGATTQQLDLF
jgi:hypothetical protein